MSLRRCPESTDYDPERDKRPDDTTEMQEIDWHITPNMIAATNSCQIQVNWKLKEGKDVEEATIDLQPQSLCNQVTEQAGSVTATAEYTWELAETIPYTDYWIEDQWEEIDTHLVSSIQHPVSRILSGDPAIVFPFLKFLSF